MITLKELGRSTVHFGEYVDRISNLTLSEYQQEKDIIKRKPLEVTASHGKHGGHAEEDHGIKTDVYRCSSSNETAKMSLSS